MSHQALHKPTAQETTDEWWRNAVVYQIYPRSFADSSGDGIGDLRGVIDNLDHLNDLGVDVIWLSPIYASPGNDNGYDISDYQAVDPMYGSLDDFDALVAQVHQLGMRLIMDLVVNHTSDEHPWFQESASSVDNPKRDWYWWRPPRTGASSGETGAEPTNWESFFSGPAWTLDPSSNEYYLHLFSPKQPDLNWENHEVRAAIYQMMRWWLDRDIDGFRMDVINLISKDPDLPDGEIQPGDRFGEGFPHYGCGPRIHEFLGEMHREVFAGRDRSYLTIGEMPGVTIEQARLMSDPSRAELNMVFQFDHMSVDHSPTSKWIRRPADHTELTRLLTAWQYGLADVGWNSLYLSNHDQPRSVSRFGDTDTYWYESSTALATLLHLQMGTPFIFQGEELGMTNTTFSSINDFRDIESLNHYYEALTMEHIDPNEVLATLAQGSRDNARTPMQWNADPHGGFTTGEPWLKVNPNYVQINAQAQRGTPGTVFEYYRQLISLRHTNSIVVHGKFRELDTQQRDVFAFTRSLDGEELVVVINLSNAPQDFDPPDELIARLASGERLLSNYPDSGSSQAGRWCPWEAAVHYVRQ